MAVKIVTVSGKGGVGKSTVCKNLGLFFSSLQKKTLLIDCDAGLSSLDIMLCCSERVNFSWADVTDGTCNLQDAVLKINENLFLLPSPVKPLTEEYENAVRDITLALDESFDYIIIDAPAGVGRGFTRAAMGATKALVVATADEVSVKGAATVAGLLKDIGVSENRLLINRYDVKSAKKGKLLTVDEIIDKTLVQLIGIIPEDKNIMYSTVSEKKLKTKKSDSAFTRVGRRISGENIELKISQLK